MKEAEKHKKIFEFLNRHKLGVVSTFPAEGEFPESAVVGFGNNEKLELVFGTSNLSRKYRNLKNNQNISFVIGWDSGLGTVQYEGIASEVSKVDEPKLVPLLINRNEGSKKYIGLKDQRYFYVKPVWVRLSDYADNPPIVYE